MDAFMKMFACNVR